jgi:hypothetical protein
MVVYERADIYIQSCTTLKDKITAIDNIIDALFATALKAAAGDNISQYMLNDGQTIINATYKGVHQIQASIAVFERLRQMYINRLNGRVIRLVDSKNFTGGFNGR